MPEGACRRHSRSARRGLTRRAIREDGYGYILPLQTFSIQARRRWFRKGLEAWFTVWVELLWPKERILVVYLNIAQFGPHVFGVEAASQLYFRKPAATLTPAEAALLAAVLPSPSVFRVRSPSRYTTRRQAWIQRQAGRLGRELPTARWSSRP